MVFVWYWMVVLDIAWNCIAFYIIVLYGMVINGSVDVIESVSCTTIISNVRVLESHLGFTHFSLIHWLHFNSSSNDNLPHGRLHKLISYWRKVMRLRSRQGRKLTWDANQTLFMIARWMIQRLWIFSCAFTLPSFEGHDLEGHDSCVFFPHTWYLSLTA